MQRLLYQKLKLWKENNSRKPLLLQGARQVGKTYLLEEFGRKEFVNYHLFNFEKFPQYSSIFEPDLNPDRILSELSLVIGKPIDPQTDLIIFDEIQECPKAINSLKYFNEVEKNLFVCCAGSLLCVSLSSESFPVGKVDFAHLYPLNFQEFLAATEEQLLIDLWQKGFKEKTIPQIGHTKLWELLKDYYVTGGYAGSSLRLSASKKKPPSGIRRSSEHTGKFDNGILQRYRKTCWKSQRGPHSISF